MDMPMEHMDDMDHMNHIEGNQMAGKPHSPDHAALENLIAGATPTHTTVKSGAWSDPTTWKNGQVPGNDANVLIAQGTAVTYDQIGVDRLKTIAIEGNLKFSTSQDTQLYIETILNSPEGKLDIGSESQPVAADKRTRIIFTSDSGIDTQWDPTQLSKGLVSHGEVNIFGADKLDRIELAGDAKAGSNALTFKQAPTGWKVGDKIVVGGTDYGWNGNDQDNSRLQDEVLTVTDISGSTVKFTNNDIKTGNPDVLRFDHLRSPLADPSKTSLYAANLTRNVSFETENGKAVPIDHRAHVMLMHNANVKVVNAGFYDLGRSDKTKLVDDIGKNVDGSNGNGTNVRGRYALHLHKTGVDDPSSPASLIEGNVVSGSPGWGIVQHESKANLTDNVVFDVVGSGIVAESGNELGSWTDNIVIKTTGIKQETIAAQETVREQKFDLGFKGEGFWIQGAAMIENKGNTAISSNDTGMSLFGGALDIGDPSFFRPVTTIPVAQLPKETQKLFPAGQTEVDIRDIPMATVEGFQAYNNVYGLDIWGHATNFDGEVYFSSDGDGKLPDTAHLGRSEVKDFKLWGSRWIGANVRYSSNIDLKNGLILGAGKEKVTGGSGLASNHAVFNAVYDSLTVAGFRQGAHVEYPGSDKNFITTTLKDSAFEGNSYNLSAVGDENDNDSRPDDFGSFLKLENNQFKVPENNLAPVASFSTKADGGLAVTLDASASADADPLLPADGTPRNLASKGIAAYGWDLNSDGTIDEFGRILDHVFDSVGSKEVSLTVLDDQGEATTVKKLIDVQPSAYGNAFAGGNFNDGTPTLEPWQNSSEYSDEGWYVHGDSKIANGVAQLSKPGGWNGFVGQVARNERVHRGEQTLSFRMKNVEGAPEKNDWEKNEVTVTLWGVNGQFANQPWEQTGPTQAGTLPMQRTELVKQVYGGKEGAATDFFDWKNISMDVNLGQGYDYLMFQVNTAATGHANDLVAIDDVSLSGKANSIGGTPTLPDPFPTLPDPNPTLPDPNPTVPKDPASTLPDPSSTLPNLDPTTLDLSAPSAPLMASGDPIVQLSFEEALGRIAKDTAVEGKANDAMLYDGVEWTQGKVGGAVKLNGANDIIRVEGSEELNQGGPYEQRTVSMWFNADDLIAEREQVLFEEGNRMQGLNMYLKENLLYFGDWSGSDKGGAGSWVSTDKADAGKWHHAAMVLDAQTGAEGTLTAYLDGEQIGQTSGAALLADKGMIGLGNVGGTTRFKDGYGSGQNNGLSGAVDEVKIFNDALSSDQIHQLATL